VPRLPDAPAAAFAIPSPRQFVTSRTSAAWAPVRLAATVRTEPSDRSAHVTRLPIRTPEGTTNLVAVLGRKRDAAGHLWVRVRLPILPNGTTGWIPRGALGGYGFVRTHLVVDLERLTATLFRDGRPIFRAPVGVGKPSSPTPSGEFYIRDQVTDYAGSFYGPLAFGTSARSATLTDWPAGGFIGIHGTNAPDLVPGRISHGCIRLRNADLVRLARLLPVGTPLTIR
jgi:hypothetical protein